jgi:uncharacterized protein YbjQ (UPF0145 family)
VKNYLFSLVILTIFLSLNIEARDDKYLFPVDEALFKHSDLVNQNIKLYFATQPPEGEVDNLGTYTSNKATNARFKSPRKSCDWAFMSAIKSLQQRAATLEGDAVVNIHSYYKSIEMFDEDAYECHDGQNISRVVLRGTVVRLRGR